MRIPNRLSHACKKSLRSAMSSEFLLVAGTARQRTRCNVCAKHRKLFAAAPHWFTAATKLLPLSVTIEDTARMPTRSSKYSIRRLTVSAVSFPTTVWP